MLQPFLQLQLTYENNLDNLDIYPAGILESREDAPGPLFKAAIIDQFIRIRDGDRYWFENRQFE